MDIELVPLQGAGPVMLGMPIDDAEELLRNLSGFESSGSELFPVRGFAHFSSGLSISASPDSSGCVQAIEIHRPGSTDIVRYAGIDVFSTPAAELIEWLGGRVNIEVHEDGRALVASELSLVFWRPTLPDDESDEDGRYFQTVTMAKPGYF
ncbi:hypothetical protein [Streptomyces sp. MBT33]|uniref:hypothetical protein n=1 Tax=Streptomyces sp. MBT33 TaxID=1488363 RepID=UPI00190CFEBA|nr:hypothetical protein [Streptomyces sp. MBT33]MBK3645957.1 hypothetical protein [Streptomyces sp. MBT33]